MKSLDYARYRTQNIMTLVENQGYKDKLKMSKFFNPLRHFFTKDKIMIRSGQTSKRWWCGLEVRTLTPYLRTNSWESLQQARFDRPFNPLASIEATVLILFRNWDYCYSFVYKHSNSSIRWNTFLQIINQNSILTLKII